MIALRCAPGKFPPSATPVIQLLFDSQIPDQAVADMTPPARKDRSKTAVGFVDAYVMYKMLGADRGGC